MASAAYYKTQIATGKRREVLEMLLRALPGKDNDAFNFVVTLSQQWHDLQDQIRAGIVDDDNARVASNKITHSLLQLLDALDEAGHLPPPPEAQAPGQGTEAEGTSYQINNTVFRIVYGDLTTLEADAYVSSDSTRLGMESGVSNAILQKAGPVYHKETRKHIPLEIGDVAVTSAGELPGKYVFHFASMDKEAQLFPGVEVLTRSTETILHLADALRVDHLVMPALGTGKAKLPFQEAAKAITKVIGKYLQQQTRLRTVTIALYTREGVTRTDLNLFYESSVGEAAIVAQNSALNAKLREMRILAEAEGLTDVLAELDAMQKKLKGGRKQLQRQSKMETLEKDLMDFGMSEALQQPDNEGINKASAEAKLSGLYSALNIKRSRLRTLEEEFHALPNPLDAPAALEMDIETLQTETSDIQRKIRQLKSAL